MSRIALRLIPGVLILCLTMPLLAGEGRVPIFRDATVINIPGKYIVTRNIVSGAGTAVIDVQAPDVDIDLNGMELTGGPAPVIHIAGVDNVAVRNGTLVKGQEGIRAVSIELGSRKITIEDMRILDPEMAGIILEGYTDFTLRRNNVIGAGSEGIRVDGSIVPDPFNVAGTIQQNHVERCGGGIAVVRGSSVGIINNRLEAIRIEGPGPALGAIVYDYGNGALIADNTIQEVHENFEFAGSGVYLGDSNGCKIVNNVVREAGINGIYLAGFSNGNMVLNNVVTASQNDGINVEGSFNQVDRNTMSDNCRNGTSACWGLHFATAFGGIDNTFGRNTARGNAGAPATCPAGPGPYPPTSDFCDETAGTMSYNDNYMPNWF